MKASALALGLFAVVACGGGTPDGRYPAHADGCPVRRYPTTPGIPVDELGVVEVECSGGGDTACERKLEDAVCHRGGDVVWGLADNSLNAMTLRGHAAHSHRATPGPRERGCALQVFPGSPPMPTENIGPVTALCAADNPRDVCEHELKDQACLLGGDVLWQVEGPTPEATSNGMRQRMHGRAAHTK